MEGDVARFEARERGFAASFIVLVDETLNKTAPGSGDALHDGFDFSFGVLAIWAVEMTF
jgi:hypothetical protein